MTKDRRPLCAGRLHEADFCLFGDHEDEPRSMERDKRRSRRFQHEEPVILETQEGELVGAVVMNYGQNGLYFESNLRVRRGTILRICNEATLSSKDGGGCRAEVRWSRRLRLDPADYDYGAGVRYCRTVVDDQTGVRQKTAA